MIDLKFSKLSHGRSAFKGRFFRSSIGFVLYGSFQKSGLKDKPHIRALTR